MDPFRGALSSMSSPFFPILRKQLGGYLVDKTQLMEKIVVNCRLDGLVDLVLRPRRCGKSTMLQMLKSFFSIPRKGDPEPHLVFEGLDIASKLDICKDHIGKYPVIFCDFKNLMGDSWEDMLSDFRDLVKASTGSGKIASESCRLLNRTIGPIMNLFVSRQLRRTTSGRVCTDCPNFSPRNSIDTLLY